jgi:hypothetical protein
VVYCFGLDSTIDNQPRPPYSPSVKPEIKRQILPFGLLVAAIASGGVCWALEGTAFWVMVGVTVALIFAGIVVAGRTESARKDKL